MRVAVCDDDERVIKKLCLLCKRIKEICLVLPFHDGSELVNYYRDGNPRLDIIVLDIRMPNMDGITTAKKIREHDLLVAIIFFTTTDEHAVQAFEYHPITYLLKPLKESKMLAALKYTISRIKHYEMTMNVRHNGIIERIRIADIRYIEKIKARNRVIFHLISNTTISCNNTIKSLQKTLPGDIFIVTDQSYIVNLYDVVRYSKTDRLIELSDGSVLPVARLRMESMALAIAKIASIQDNEP